MKWYHGIILFFVGLLIGAGAWAVIDYKFFPCPEAGIVVTPHEQPDPTPNPGAPDPYLCGPMITIEGMMYKDNLFRATAYNNCMSAYRDFGLVYHCPLPKYSIHPSLLAGVGRMPDKTFDALVGGELAVMRHFGHYGVGGGGWYIQGLLSDFKAGGLKATFYGEFGKQ